MVMFHSNIIFCPLQQKMPPKNWDKIVSDIPTPPDSDEEDVLNVEMVKKNALRVSDLLHHMMPNLPTELAGDLPKGMNRIGDFNNHIRKQFHQSTDSVLREALQSSRAKNDPHLAGHDHEPLPPPLLDSKSEPSNLQTGPVDDEKGILV